MKEWDLDSYIRKFKDSVTVFAETNTKVAQFVRDITVDDEGKILFRCKNEWEEKEPIYFRFESRIYETKTGWVSIRRRIKKSWKIGLSNDGFIINPYKGSTNLENIEVLSPLKPNVLAALKKEGPISNKFFLTKNTVLLLDKEVGLRKGSKFLVKESVCQELQDALQEFECSIST